MSIENIMGNILAEAQEESNQVLEKSRDKSLALVAEAKAKAEKLQEEFHDKARIEADLLKSRRTSVANLEVRKMRLGAKQAFVSKCFDIALEQLANLEKDAYLEFMAGAIADIDTDSGELLLNPRDREAIGAELINRVNSTGKVGTLTLAEDTIDAKGGFILRKGSMEMNATLETMVNEIREAATPEVVKALFG